MAYRDDVAVGWTRVVPRSTLPAITEIRALVRMLDEDPDAWWASRFVVRREHRGGGIGPALLEAAVDWAAQHGFCTRAACAAAHRDAMGTQSVTGAGSSRGTRASGS